VAECQLPKLDVGGSNPLARFFISRFSKTGSGCFHVQTFTFQGSIFAEISFNMFYALTSIELSV
jgi:hypothetical protein